MNESELRDLCGTLMRDKLDNGELSPRRQSFEPRRQSFLTTDQLVGMVHK